MGKLIEQGAKSSSVKFALQKVQDNKVNLDKRLESRHRLLKSDSLTMLVTAENIVTEINPVNQQELSDALNYVNSCNAAANDLLEKIETSEVSGVESSEFSKDDEKCSHALKKSNANETLDKGFKLTKEANQSALILKIGDRLNNSFCEPQSPTSGPRKKFSPVDYFSTRTLALSEPLKKACSKVGSIVS